MAIKPKYPRKISKLAASFAILSLLAACTGKHNPQESTQVAAKVGKYEITNFEVNNAVSRVPNIPQDQLAAAREAALESIVREELLIQQAQTEKLDRQPQVVAEIEAARRSIIARTYVAQVADSQTKPSEEDVHDYYQQHPELFSSRRVYTVKEVTTRANPQVSEYLRDFAASGKTLEQFAQWLQQNKIPFQANSGTRDPESLPLTFLPTLAATKDGNMAIFSSNAVIYVAQVQSSRPAPISEERAAPNIKRFITAQRSKAAVDREIARLRANTKIEYQGEFAKSSSLPSSEGEQVPSMTEQSGSLSTGTLTSVAK